MFTCVRPGKNTDVLNKKIVLKKNAKMATAFAAVPFAERVVFVPHCMRSAAACAAQEMGSYYICKECGACKIGAINKKSRDLGYKAAYVLKGGRTIEKLVAETRPKAVIGVACYFEGVQGMELAKKDNLIVQFVPLTKDGCADTDVDLDEVFSMLEKIKP